jgi:hypothetical protein
MPSTVGTSQTPATAPNGPRRPSHRTRRDRPGHTCPTTALWQARRARRRPTASRHPHPRSTGTQPAMAEADRFGATRRFRFRRAVRKDERGHGSHDTHFRGRPNLCNIPQIRPFRPLTQEDWTGGSTASFDRTLSGGPAWLLASGGCRCLAWSVDADVEFQVRRGSPYWRVWPPVILEVSTSTVCRSVLTPPGPGGQPSVGGS